MSAGFRSVPFRPLLLAAAFAIVPAAARAQAPEPAPDGDVCYRFAFGDWQPALDRVAAGHDPQAHGGPGAPNGRDWAVSNLGGATLMLFPGWWPAGVSVQLPGPPPAAGDTARGRATALVADGRQQAPQAAITIIGVPCVSTPRPPRP